MFIKQSAIQFAFLVARLPDMLQTSFYQRLALVAPAAEVSWRRCLPRLSASTPPCARRKLSWQRSNTG